MSNGGYYFPIQKCEPMYNQGFSIWATNSQQQPLKQGKSTQRKEIFVDVIVRCALS
ncbi:MAG: hypothetical protein IPJ22_13460 [Bacteroidetes bacterium]|nr:hypothetical protein [Bacteroidota bacterium]